MSKAKQPLLEDLHNVTATEMARIIREGVPVVDKAGEVQLDADGNALRMPAPAAYFAAVIKFLKDNDITADLAPESPMQGLVDELPEFDDDENVVNFRN